jgi:hypothetical protein
VQLSRYWLVGALLLLAVWDAALLRASPVWYSVVVSVGLDILTVCASYGLMRTGSHPLMFVLAVTIPACYKSGHSSVLLASNTSTALEDGLPFMLSLGQFIFIPMAWLASFLHARIRAYSSHTRAALELECHALHAQSFALDAAMLFQAAVVAASATTDSSFDAACWYAAAVSQVAVVCGCGWHLYVQLGVQKEIFDESMAATAPYHEQTEFASQIASFLLNLLLISARMILVSNAPDTDTGTSSSLLVASLWLLSLRNAWQMASTLLRCWSSAHALTPVPCCPHVTLPFGLDNKEKAPAEPTPTQPEKSPHSTSGAVPAPEVASPSSSAAPDPSSSADAAAPTSPVTASSESVPAPDAVQSEPAKPDEKAPEPLFPMSYFVKAS